MKPMTMTEAKSTYKDILTLEAQRVSTQIFSMIEVLIEFEADEELETLMNEWITERQTWVEGIKECNN